MNSPLDVTTKNMTSDKWLELHENLQDLLAGYYDNELEDDQVNLVEAHLIGCQACRNDLHRQQTLSQHLESMPLSKMSPSAHKKIDKALENIPLKKAFSQKLKIWFAESLLFINSYKMNLKLATLFGASGWGIALLLTISIYLPQYNQPNSNTIPMIKDALTEYYEMEGKALPVSIENNKELKPPISWPNTRLLSSWSTKIGGSPAKVYALRSGNNIIFQYQINESIFFRNAVVRKAISENGSYSVRDNKTGVLAIPLSNSGVLVVGEKNSLPTPENIIF